MQRVSKPSVVHQTSFDKRRISPAIAIPSRRLHQLISRIKPTGRPANNANEHVRVLLQEGDLLAQILLTAGSIPTPGLGVDRQPLVLPQPCREWAKRVVDVVGHTLSVRARVIAVKVLVHVKDDVIRPPIRVRHLKQRRPSLGGQRLRRGPATPRDEDEARRRDGPDGRDDLLHGGHPRVDGREVVRLVHHAEDHAAVAAVLGRELPPQADELVVRRAA